MKCEVVSVRDKLSGFAEPVLEINIDTAKRRFSDAIKDTKIYGRHVEDFSLYRLGSFDSDLGFVFVPDSPELICTAFDLVGKEVER